MMFEGIILKCDIHASMLCLSGLIFFKPIRHIVWNEEDSVTAGGAQMNAHYPETRCLADGMKSVCFSWNTLLWLSCDSWKHAWIISVILISCYHGGECHRRDSGQRGSGARPAALARTSRWSLAFLLGFTDTRHHFLRVKSLRVFQPALCCLETYQLLDRALVSYSYFFFFLAEISKWARVCLCRECYRSRQLVARPRTADTAACVRVRGHGQEGWFCS